MNKNNSTEKRASIRPERDSDLTTGNCGWMVNFCADIFDVCACAERQEMRRESEISRMVRYDVPTSKFRTHASADHL